MKSKSFRLDHLSGRFFGGFWIRPYVSPFYGQHGLMRLGPWGHSDNYISSFDDAKAYLVRKFIELAEDKKIKDA